MNRYATIAILASSLFIDQAMAARKPLNGLYKCKGTVNQEILIDGVGAGNVEAKIKGKLSASRGSFTVAIKTDGWQSMFAGYLEPDMQKVAWSSMNRTYKTMSRGCNVSDMWQIGSGYQSRSGRSVSFYLAQGYYCGLSGVENIDRYRLTCKR